MYGRTNASFVLCWKCSTSDSSRSRNWDRWMMTAQWASVALFRPGINICPEWSDHQWTAVSTGGNAPKMLWGSIWEPTTLTTFRGGLTAPVSFSFFLAVCVLGHVEGPPTQLTILCKQEDATTTDLIFMRFTVLQITCSCSPNLLQMLAADVCENTDPTSELTTAVSPEYLK